MYFHWSKAWVYSCCSRNLENIRGRKRRILLADQLPLDLVGSLDFKRDSSQWPSFWYGLRSNHLSFAPFQLHQLLLSFLHLKLYCSTTWVVIKSSCLCSRMGGGRSRLLLPSPQVEAAQGRASPSSCWPAACRPTPGCRQWYCLLWAHL